MAQGIVTQDRRTVRAVGIVERHECELQDNGAWRVRDTATGSGRWHTVFNGHCTCPDYLTRGATCKHQIAVQAEEQALAQYAANWNSRSAEARAALDDLPGDFLDTDLNFADDMLTVDRDRDHSPRCPDCAAPLQSQSYHVGGRGMMCFLICSKHVEHRALPA